MAMRIDLAHQHMVLDRQGGGLIGAEVVDVVSLTGQGGLDMMDDGLDNRGNI